MCGQGSHRGKTVLGAEGKTANTQQSDDSTNVSVLVCVNAEGGHVPPFFILPGATLCEEYTNKALGGSTFAASKSAFITTELFIQYFEWFAANIPADRPVLVIMDGCRAHISALTLELARNDGIFIHTLPAHTSHFLQPLDATVFLHFKRELDKEIDIFRVRNGYPATKYNMVELASIAQPRCWTRTHVVSGFEKTGLFPLSKEAMLRGIIGDGPVEKAMILLKPTLIISERTRNRLKRDGLDPDTVRVLSLNDWDMVKAQERKKPKLAKPDGFIKGGKLMTADAVISCIKAKEEEKMAKFARQRDRQAERVRKQEEKVVQKYLAAEKKRVREQQRAEHKLAQAQQQAVRVRAHEQKKMERERTQKQKKADREQAKQLRKKERLLVARELKLMRQEDKSSVLRQRRLVEARKRDLKSTERPACQVPKKGEHDRRPLQELDQNIVFLGDNLAVV